MADRFMPGFTQADIRGSAGHSIHCVHAGSGPAVLLLHGHPQTHVTWHQVAPGLVEAGFTVVAADLRGYGDSAKPDGGENHANYAKRAMAQDQVDIMRALGHARFAVVGHDRGGRVAHRMALDHQDALRSVAVLDIAPTATMYARTDRAFATKYFWWFFLIQKAPLPEHMIGADPEFYLRAHVAGQSRTPGVPSEDLIQEYLRCYTQPGGIHAICEDYRAAASIDLEHDAADSAARITAPLLALWGERGVVHATYDVLATWREKALDVRGHPIDCGHALQEEAPGATLAALLPFLRETID